MTNENTDQITYISLTKLVESPLNVRKQRTEEGLTELKANILARGLLKNLIVYEAEKGKYAVAGGERRRRCLKALAKEKKISGSLPVPCLIRTEAEAIELSLAENMHCPMHPADQFEAFAAMIESGLAVEDVAANFGVAPLVVSRRMKLARVSPVIFQAFRDGQINLDCVMAFTISANHIEQETVYKNLRAGHMGVSRSSITRALTHDQTKTSDKLFRFVGEADYVAAGGAIVRDLFDDEGGGFATDSGLLDRLASAKLNDLIPTLQADGWKWLIVTLDVDWQTTSGFAEIRKIPAPLDAETAALRDKLVEQHDAMIEANDDMEPDEGEQGEKFQDIVAQLEAIDERSSTYDTAHMALAGGWLTVNFRGEAETKLGYIRKEDVAAYNALVRNDPTTSEDNEDADLDGESDGDPTAEATTAPPEASGLSDALKTDLHAARTMALRLELAHRPDIALRTVAHSLAARLITSQYSVLTLSAHEVYIPAPSKTHCPDDVTVQNKAEAWKSRLSKKPEDLWADIMALSDADTMDLIAVCAALTIDATYAKHPDHAARQRMATANDLAETLELNMAQHWTPTAESFFGRVSKSTILDAVTDAQGEAQAKKLAGLKKGLMAQEAESIVSGTGWLPAILRTKASNSNHAEEMTIAAE